MKSDYSTKAGEEIFNPSKQQAKQMTKNHLNNANNSANAHGVDAQANGGEIDTF